MSSNKDSSDEPSPTLLQTIGSVIAAFFGVQSSRNRERDFQRGKPLAFIVVGVLMTVALIGLIWTVVHLALKSAGQ